MTRLLKAFLITASVLAATVNADAQTTDPGLPGSGVFVLWNFVDQSARLVKGREPALIRIAVYTDGPLSIIDSYSSGLDLQFGSNDSSEIGRSLQDALRAMGLQRIVIAEMDLDTSKQDHISADCSVNDGKVAGLDGFIWSMLIEVDYWSAETFDTHETFRATTKGYQEPEQYSTQTYVRACADLIGGVLGRLGYKA